MLATFCRVLLATLLVMTFTGYLTLVFLYKVKDEGVLYLPKAREPVSITREADTHIAHIRANTLVGALYG